MEEFAKTRVGGWVALNVANPVDQRLMRWSNGRVSIFIGQNTGVLTHTGAKSGLTRETPLLYTVDGDHFVIVASNAGGLRHPAWYHNVCASPEVGFATRGRRGKFTAHVAEGEERKRLWAEVNDQYSGYDDYQERTDGRLIPVVVLEPRSTP